MKSVWQGGGAVILVRAGYKPLSVPNTTREVMAEMGATDMGSLTEEIYVKDQLRPMLSVHADHPLMLSCPSDPTSRSLPMADWPIPLAVTSHLPKRCFHAMPGWLISHGHR
jgi:hypothetical protein